MTEHDTIHDFAPVVAAMPGAAEFVQPLTGSEITTYMYGHFNAYPLTEKPDHYSHGGIEWFDTWAPELLQRIRDSEDHEVIIQVNHPRGAGIGAYLSAVGLDIATGTIENWDNWTDDLDAIEVFNGGCSNGNREELRDWFDFLNRGYRISVSAGSDSHSEFSELGAPRLYMRTDHDVEDFTHDELVQNFQNLSVFASCGPFVRFSIDGKNLGETLSATGPVIAHARVEAPSFMTLTELRILRNGEVAWSLPASDWPPVDGAVRFDGVIELDPGSDCWYALEVVGSGGQHPITGNTPYAVTSPIYIDVDGNGQFDPPLPPYSERN